MLSLCAMRIWYKWYLYLLAAGDCLYIRLIYIFCLIMVINYFCFLNDIRRSHCTSFSHHIPHFSTVIKDISHSSHRTNTKNELTCLLPRSAYLSWIYLLLMWICSDEYSVGNSFDEIISGYFWENARDDNDLSRTTTRCDNEDANDHFWDHQIKWQTMPESTRVPLKATPVNHSDHYPIEQQNSIEQYVFYSIVTSISTCIFLTIYAFIFESHTTCQAMELVV